MSWRCQVFKYLALQKDVHYDTITNTLKRFSQCEAIIEDRALSVSQEGLRTLYHTLETNPRAVHFADNEEVILMRLSIKSLQHPFTKESALTLTEWALGIREVFGAETWLGIFSDLPFQSGQDTLTEVIQLAKITMVAGQYISIPTILKGRLTDSTPLSDVIEQVQVAYTHYLEQKYPEPPLDTIIHRFGSENEALLVALPSETLFELKARYVAIHALGATFKTWSVEKLRAEIPKNQVRRGDTWSVDQQNRLIAIARELIRHHYNLYPYATQMLALLGTIASPDTLKGRFAQVKTGEGKSTIVAMLTVYMASQGKTVDVISSSRYLAIRDHKKYADYFQDFGISSQNICTDSPKPEHFAGQVLYGTNYDFEFAWLRDQLHNAQLRCYPAGSDIPRPFDMVIIDEVDCMLIDNAVNSARMAIPSRAGTWVYPVILDHLKSTVLNLAGSPIPHSPQTLTCFLSSIENGKHKDWVTRIGEVQIQHWFASGKAALETYQINRHYVIQSVEKSTLFGVENKQNVVIVDYQHTGRLQEKSQWQHGVHQFLQAKHGLEIDAETSTAAAISHPVFFGYYAKMYGVTGTMGNHQERHGIQTCYDIDTFDVPPHLPTQRQMLASLYFPDTPELYAAITAEITLMQTQKRPSLILFKSIEDSLSFSAYLFGENLEHLVLNAIQSEHEDHIISKAGQRSAITIATNTAGRGTDIVLYPDAINGGGMRVIMTFYPENERVKDQGFGRAARQGQPGSGRLMISGDDDKIKTTPILALLRALGTGASQEPFIFAALKRSQESSLQQLSDFRLERAAVARGEDRVLSRFFEAMKHWRQETPLWQTHLKQKLTAASPQTPQPETEQEHILCQQFIRYQALAQKDPTFDWTPWLTLGLTSLEEHFLQQWSELYTQFENHIKDIKDAHDIEQTLNAKIDQSDMCVFFHHAMQRELYEEAMSRITGISVAVLKQV